MTINWDSYEIYSPAVVGPLNTLPRAEARRAFDRLMAERPARIEMLRRLLKANGVELSNTDDGLLQPNPSHRRESRLRRHLRQADRARSGDRRRRCRRESPDKRGRGRRVLAVGEDRRVEGVMLVSSSHPLERLQPAEFGLSGGVARAS